MIAWTGIEHFIAGRFDDPPAVDEPDDMQVTWQINMLSWWVEQNKGHHQAQKAFFASYNLVV